MDSSNPFRSEFASPLDWNVEIYCSAKCYQFEREMQQVLRDGFNDEFNGTAVCLTCALEHGFSTFIYVVGRQIKERRPLVTHPFWVNLNLIWDSVDFHETGGDASSQVERIAQKKYEARNWGPVGRNAGADVYATNLQKCYIWRRAVDNSQGYDGTQQSQGKPNEGAP